MTSSAVVILTDPARCQFADTDALLKAVLQVQQLSQAGVPGSQAFCDHPAAAQDFIEAYSRAYPELQQQSSDLPLPEDLHSMVAEGRFSPLVAPTQGDFTKLGEVEQLYPFYVLSLGAPEALKQALQHNALASSRIRVLEIAPIEHTRAESMPAANVVAHEAVARPARSTASSSEIQKEDHAISPPNTPRDCDPLRLEGVEADLDYIQVEEDRALQHRDQNSQPSDQWVAAMTGNVPGAGGEVAGADLFLPNHPGQASTTGRVGVAPLPAQPAPEPFAELPLPLQTPATAPTQPKAMRDPVLDAAVWAPAAEQGQPAGDGESAAEGSADGEPFPGDPPADTPGGQVPAANGSLGEGGPPAPNEAPTMASGPAAKQDPAEAPIAASGPAIEQDPIAPQASTAEPNEDVGSALAEPARHGARPTEKTSGNGASPSDPPDGRPADQIPATDDSGSERATPLSAAPDHPTEAPIAASDRAAGQDCVAPQASSFAEPGQDVRYAPTDDFAWGDDLRYPLPVEFVPDIDVVEHLFDLAAQADVIDLEALCSDLRPWVDAAVAAAEDFDLQSEGPAASDFSASHASPHDASPHRHETPDQAHDDAHGQAPTAIHDTDL